MFLFQQRAIICCVTLASACAISDGDVPEGAEAACESLPGSYFQTNCIYECGLDAPFCRWTAQFSETQFWSTSSDTVVSGTYRCDGGAIMNARTETRFGFLDAATDILTVDPYGYAYVRVR